MPKCFLKDKPCVIECALFDREYGECSFYIAQTTLVKIAKALEEINESIIWLYEGLAYPGSDETTVDLNNLQINFSREDSFTEDNGEFLTG